MNRRAFLQRLAVVGLVAAVPRLPELPDPEPRRRYWSGWRPNTFVNTHPLEWTILPALEPTGAGEAFEATFTTNEASTIEAGIFSHHAGGKMIGRYVLPYPIRLRDGEVLTVNGIPVVGA